MKFYSVHRTCSDGSVGYEWFTTIQEARRVVAEWRQENKGDLDSAEITAVHIEPTKQGILSALRVHASHPDNG